VRSLCTGATTDVYRVSFAGAVSFNNLHDFQRLVFYFGAAAKQSLPSFQGRRASNPTMLCPLVWNLCPLAVLLVALPKDDEAYARFIEDECTLKELAWIKAVVTAGAMELDGARRRLRCHTSWQPNPTKRPTFATVVPSGAPSRAPSSAPTLPHPCSDPRHCDPRTTRCVKYSNGSMYACKCLNGFVPDLLSTHRCVTMSNSYVDQIQLPAPSDGVDCSLSQPKCSKCSSMCGSTGEYICTRRILIPLQFGGKACGPTRQTQTCNHIECPRDCHYQPHNQSCTACGGIRSCGIGFKECRSNVLQNAAFGGRACPPSVQKSCRRPACPADCEVTGFSPWSVCGGTDQACNAASMLRFPNEIHVKYRHRIMLRPPEHGGGLCPSLEEQKRCRCPTAPPTAVPTLAPSSPPTQKRLQSAATTIHMTNGRTLCCRFAIGKVLRNPPLAGKTFRDVASARRCCRLCGQTRKCGSWEYSTQRVCVLMLGRPQYHKLFAQHIVTWAGPRPLPPDPGLSCPAA
jgi:hypothetical protein